MDGCPLECYSALSLEHQMLILTPLLPSVFWIKNFI